jgi:hypothetical protein
MKWNLEELKTDVNALYGSQQRERLAIVLNSIAARQLHARFHFQESKRLINESLECRDEQSVLADLILGADPEAYQKFTTFRMYAEAHVIACVQSLHSISDILGHAIYFALGWNLPGSKNLSARRVTLHIIASRLPDCSAKALLNDLVEA